MTTTTTKEITVANIADAAEIIFFDFLAHSYPEIKTGDFPPEAALELSTAFCSAIHTWLKCNEVDSDEISDESKFTTIMLHRIEYLYPESPTTEMTASDREHVAYCISNDCGEGDFCDEYAGFWRIANEA